MIVNCAIVGMMDLGYNASSLLREYTGVISEWRDVDSIISIDCEESVNLLNEIIIPLYDNSNYLKELRQILT